MLFVEGKVECRNRNKLGNLVESLDRLDRKYAKGGQLIQINNWTYKYDKEGSLNEKKTSMAKPDGIRGMQ